MRKTPVAIACALAFGLSGTAFAADSADVQAMKQQMEALQQQLNALQTKVNSAPAAASSSKSGISYNPNDPLTLHVGDGAVTLYGHADLSYDVANNGQEKINQISSNLSYIGVKGFHPLGNTGLKAVVQVETLADISATPTEKGGLASRNSFVGLSGGFGTVMLGKTDTPYKRSTAALDPFSASVGDYNTIMGNTGGDSRAEFDARLSHSLFYDSPKVAGFSVNALFSPSQKLHDNLSGTNNSFPVGEKVCSGATPGSSGSTPDSNGQCDDGGFHNAYSIAGNYSNGPIFATVAYEMHQSVNRTSDALADGTVTGIVGNESAAKIGLAYDFGSNKLAAIYEDLFRSGVPAIYNERARKGWYVSDVQKLGGGFDLMAAWAHAGNTGGSQDFPGVDNHANMYDLGVKYHFDKRTSLYLVAAYLDNSAGAHYALGAGGHGAVIAAPRDATTGETIPGAREKAISAGMQFNF
jgi:predicted porin